MNIKIACLAFLVLSSFGCGSDHNHQDSKKISVNLSSTQLIHRAQEYLSEGNTELGILDLKSAIMKDSLNPSLRHKLADVQMDYLKSREALSTMVEAFEDFPEDRMTLLKLSEFQLILQKHKDALYTIQRLVDMNVQDDEAYFMLGLTTLDMQKPEKALEAFQKATELNGDHIDAWMMMGSIYMDEGNSLALQCFKNILAIDPDNWPAMHNKAFYLQNNGDLTGAKRIYRSIIEQNPQYDDASFNLGILLYEQDSLKEAMEHFIIGIKINPQNAMNYYYQGLVYEKQNKWSMAIDSYEQALRLVPSFKRAEEALKYAKVKSESQ